MRESHCEPLTRGQPERAPGFRAGTLSQSASPRAPVAGVDGILGHRDVVGVQHQLQVRLWLAHLNEPMNGKSLSIPR